MERARYRQSDLRRMALGVRTIPSLFIALTSYKLLAVLLLMETFLLPGTFVVGGLALPACTLLFLACSLVCLAFAMLFRRLTFHDHSWYLGLLIACLMLGLFLLLLRELGGVGNAALASACRGLGIALVAAGLIGVHIEMARIMGALGMTQTLTFGVSAAFAAGLLYLALTLLPVPQGRWMAAFALPLVLAASFSRARRNVYRSRKTRFEEPEAEVLVPYRFIVTSVAQGVAAGLLVALASRRRAVRTRMERGGLSAGRHAHPGHDAGMQARLQPLGVPDRVPARGAGAAVRRHRGAPRRVRRAR